MKARSFRARPGRGAVAAAMFASFTYIALLIAGIVGLPAQAQAPVPVPALSARVTDLTGTLAAAERQALEEILAAFEQRKGSQIAVLIVPTTGQEPIEQYAMRVAESWRLGRKGVDDGALLLIARDDRRLRIEVGYGLEGAVPDIIAKRIVSDVISPRLREGDFQGGIRAGVDALIGVVEGEPLPEPERRPGGSRSSGLTNLLPVLIMIALVGGTVLRGLFGRLGGAATTGAVIGGIVWFVLGALGIALVAAIIAFLFTIGGGVPRGWSSNHRGGFGGGFGGFGGGGFGGGGFGGGGGRFGGGGASGSW